MTAKYAPRVSTENRTILQDVIPLDTPLVLQIEPTNYCNLQCQFCPIGDRAFISRQGLGRGTMDLDLFRRMISDLSKFKHNIKTIHLYGNGEPLIHPDLSGMIQIAKKSGHVDFIDTTTNGILLSHNKSEMLVKAGLDKIAISVNGISDEDYIKNTRTRIHFGRFYENLKHLYNNRGNCKVYIKSISELYTEEERDRFFEMFSPISDYIFMENLINPWPGFDVESKMDFKSTKSAFSNKATMKIVCCSMFYTMVIKWDGRVSLCCTDWKNDLVIGDVREESLKSIWGSDKLYFHQVQQLKGERYTNGICRNCNQVWQGIYDNIDPYRGKILEKMVKLRGEI